MNLVLILCGKIFSLISRALGMGHGSTWPGHIALNVKKDFIKDVLKNSEVKILLIAGTNGKTTTAKLIQTVLEKDSKRVFRNTSGANLLNGIASSIVLHTNILCTLNYYYAIFEVDENSLPLVLNELTPNYLILLNLFRDQLDRYGEVNTIVNKWRKAIQQLNNKTILILNADDPQIAFLGLSRHSGEQSDSRIDSGQARMTYYFGLNDRSLHQKSPQHAVDSIYCPNCGNKLTYHTVYFSHLGNWKCSKCPYKRPKPDITASPVYPLTGIYNLYNTHAAALFAKLNNISNETIKQSLERFFPAFGRQEIININNKRVQIFLSKNPTSFNQSLHTVKKLRGKNLLLVLNDRIPDGRDVSWIWDVDFEDLVEKKANITISGDRCYDLGLRIKYASPSQVQNAKFKVQNYSSKFKNNFLIHNSYFIIQENLNEAIQTALNKIKSEETLYILPTYSAMLEVRKILTGRKIL